MALRGLFWEGQVLSELVGTGAGWGLGCWEFCGPLQEQLWVQPVPLTSLLGTAPWWEGPRLESVPRLLRSGTLPGSCTVQLLPQRHCSLRRGLPSAWGALPLHPWEALPGAELQPIRRPWSGEWSGSAGEAPRWRRLQRNCGSSEQGCDCQLHVRTSRTTPTARSQLRGSLMRPGRSLGFWSALESPEYPACPSLGRHPED